jgi:hypothetical protein
MTACGVRWCRCGSTARLRKPRRSSELTQSLSQRPYLACLMPQPPARGGRFGGVATVLVVAVVYSLRSTRSQRATVHPAAPPASHGRRPTRLSRSGPGSAPGRVPKLVRFLGRLLGVVRHFSPSPPPLWQSIICAFGPTEFDRSARRLDITGFGQTVAKRGNQ